MRNKHLSKQLRAALRASSWRADMIAFRASVSRATMARVLAGDVDVSIGEYERVAEQLEVSIAFVPYKAAGQPPAPEGVLDTVVNRAKAKLFT
ncbi:XRE family transcriptional regulator [Aquabacterium soli]|uniref:XRE family transcriptional regulator n=1 Tax=Aquabacterium soli TaxID=2493092 RepID=A0A426V2G3_9BURK|nr:helix-turn-helix transcriptional regulator [Aquabacterium soli]RRS01094.1 XRE family transcriptional regulator [Aquabacterium soli]